MECPAEIVIQRARYGRWTWAVCQPDANWGEYCGGICGSYEEAAAKAQSALHLIHFKQGYYNGR